MRSIVACLVFGLALSAGLSATAARSEEDDEQKIKVADLPKGGLEAVKKMFPDAKVVGATKEKDHGKTMYEVELKNNGKTIDVMIDKDGKVATIEKEISGKDLPAAASKAITAKYGDSKWKKVEEVTQVKDGKQEVDFYELLIGQPKEKDIEIKVTPDGEISMEDSDEEESEKEDDENNQKDDDEDESDEVDD